MQQIEKNWEIEETRRMEDKQRKREGKQLNGSKWMIRHINNQIHIYLYTHQKHEEKFDPSEHKYESETKKNASIKNEQLILGYKILIRLITKFQLVMNTQRVCWMSEWANGRKETTSKWIYVSRLAGWPTLLAIHYSSSCRAHQSWKP